MSDPQRVYGLVVAGAGALLSVCLLVFRAGRRGFSPPRALAGSLLGLLLSLLLAKSVWLLFFAASLGAEDAGKWFRAVPGEFSFTAGCIGFCLGPALAWLRRRDRLPALMDLLAFPGCLLAAFVRFAEIFWGQLGLADVYTLGLPDIPDASLLARFPFAVRDAWGIWYLAVSTLSAVLALAVAACALLRTRAKARPLPAGTVFERSAFLLCAACFFLDLTRMETLVFMWVHVNQALCALVMLALAVRAACRQQKASGRFPVFSLALTFLCFVLNGFAQYLADKPWVFEPLLPDGVFSWMNDNLLPLVWSLLLLTALVPVLLHGRLLRKAAAPREPVP